MPDRAPVSPAHPEPATVDPGPQETRRRGAALLATAVAVPVAVATLVALRSLLPAPPALGDQQGTPGTTVPVAGLPSTDPGSAAVCARLVAALPDTMGPLHRRPVSGAGGRAAAWGDPPVVLRCGTSAPAGDAPLGQVITLDGVDYDPQPSDAGVTWRLVGRRVPVEIFVPKVYDGQGSLVIAVSGAIAAADPAG